MSGAATPPLVEGRGLSKAYPGVVALDGVSFRIEAGEVVGLVGKNGAGKSTLIKALAGVVPLDAGEILIDGEEAQLSRPDLATRAGLAFVHQELVDVPNLSVADNVFLGLGLPKLGPFVNERKLHRRAKAVLDSLDADVPTTAKVGALSPVQQRLVMIARALAQSARLIVLDEPSASLTNEEVEHLHAVVRRLAAQGVAIVYVSHRLGEIRSLTSRILVMRDGSLVAERATADIDHSELVRLITGGTGALGISRREAVATPDPEVPPLLRVENLAAGPLVRGVSLTVRAGEVVGLAGLLGSGRSELAKAVCGASPSTSGTVSLNGKAVRLRSPAHAIKAGIVLLPEDRRAEGNVLDMSVRENVTLASLRRMRMNRLLPMPSRGKERRAAISIGERLKLRSAGPEAQVRWLSGGNQQKVLFAKWLTRGADVLVLDEPTQGIDVEAKAEVFELVNGLCADGKGVLLISSDFSELVRMCDRVVVLREGEAVAEFSGDELAEQALLGACYGTTGGS
jgi:rhamnose transport system ATP-binding protein